LREVLSTYPHTWSSACGEAALLTLLDQYYSELAGLIVYDPALPDTINVATTLAGQRHGIVVSPTQAEQFAASYQLSVLVDLRIYGWTSRLQAYRWAYEHLLPAASLKFVAGLDPRITGGLRSYVVATNTFVYWLDSQHPLAFWRSEQASERALLRKILAAYPAGTVHLGWFRNESSGVNLTSRSAISVLASDYFSNLEVWSATQARSFDPVPIEETPPVCEDKIYLSFTISDGDNLQFTQHRLLRLWQHELRGSLPIGWTFAPALLQAAPALASYYKSSATPQDELIAGPSGAAYIFPSHWPDEELAPFLQTTGQLMQALGMTTLEVLDTAAWESAGLPAISHIPITGMSFTDQQAQQHVVQALKPYGLRGLLSGAGVLWPGARKVAGVPLYRNLGLAGSVKGALRLIKLAQTRERRRPLFINLYLLAWTMDLPQIQQIVRQLGNGYEVVLPRTLLAMLAQTKM
jgi:hypothetical protein